MPHVETYWESWDQTYGNYGSNLSNLPVVPIGLYFVKKKEIGLFKCPDNKINIFHIYFQ